MNRELKKEVKKCKDPQPWDLTNGILYNLCKNHFGHTKRNEIIAKTMIIGRTYSVSLDRKKPDKEMETYDFYTKLVYNALRNQSFCTNLKRLKRKKVLNEKNLIEILKTHKQLIDLLQKCVNNKQCLHSFASKYLHFHLPKLFYIYDKYANAEIRKIKKEIGNHNENDGIQLDSSLKCLQKKMKVSKFDEDYRDYVIYCFVVCQFFKRHGFEIAPRQLDNLLQKRHRIRR
jgi:hypothetical protein